MTIFLPTIPPELQQELAQFCASGFHTTYNALYPPKKTNPNQTISVEVDSLKDDYGDASSIVLFGNETPTDSHPKVFMYTPFVHKVHLCNRLYIDSRDRDIPDPKSMSYIQMHLNAIESPALYKAHQAGFHIVSSPLPIVYGSWGIVMHPDLHNAPLLHITTTNWRNALKYPQITLWNLRVCQAWVNGLILPVPPFM